jgi:hypothetical protein
MALRLARHMMIGFWPQAVVDGSHAPRGSTWPDALRRLLGDAERHGRHSHAERGNDHRSDMMIGFWPQAVVDGSHAPRGSTWPDAPRRLLGDAERHGRHSHAERGNDHRSDMMIGFWPQAVVDGFHAPRGSSCLDALRRLLCDAERHGRHSHAERGNDHRSDMMIGFWPQAIVDGSHAPRGSTCPDALRLLLGDAERHGRHPHAERGNDHRSGAAHDGPLLAAGRC